MEIHEIKSKLDILKVAGSLGIQIHHITCRAHCPFHNDKTPSLQFSQEKQIATCFSSNCTAGTMDVIKLAEKKLGLGTHEAINWLKKEYALMLDSTPTSSKSSDQKSPSPIQYEKLFKVFEANLKKSERAKLYLQQRSLIPEALSVGYNVTGWARMKHCLIFPLKDAENKIVNFYGRSILDKSESKHFYMPERKGLYPKYPEALAETLILTESVIDAATLEQYRLSRYENYPRRANILALYGTNGLIEEHQKAIKELKHLQEIILFFDGDEAGRKAVVKQAAALKALKPDIKISNVETPEGEDVNSLLVSHNPEVLEHLLKIRKLIADQKQEEVFSFSSETPVASNEKKTAVQQKAAPPRLDTSNPHNYKYLTPTASYYIKGGLRKELDSLRVTLVIEAPEQPKKSRTKVDLYEDKQVEKTAREAAEKLGLRTDLVEQDLSQLTDLLDELRESQQEEKEENPPYIIPSSEKEKCLQFLKQPKLIDKINHLIGKSGVTGEEENRIFLFGIAASHKMPDTLHALVQGSSGSGKTHLVKQIAALMPEEDVIKLTRVTESSFYNYGEYELKGKLLIIEDYDGLKEEAELALRELQSNGELNSSTSVKDEVSGQIRAQIRKVKGPIGSLAATTRSNIYEDNMSRCFSLAVDESREQTKNIIEYQNQKAAGLIDKRKEEKAKLFLQHCIRLLHPYEVVNPYAAKVMLPEEAHKIRRLNELYQSFVKQITLLNQYQRSKDSRGRIIAQKEDLELACRIMFDSIVLKVDELDGALRSFYEALKSYVKSKGEGYSFSRREIRHELKLSKTQQHTYLRQLQELEYICLSGGYANRGFNYKINYWDNYQKLRAGIQQRLNEQLQRL